MADLTQIRSILAMDQSKIRGTIGFDVLNLIGVLEQLKISVSQMTQNSLNWILNTTLKNINFRTFLTPHP